MRTNVNALLEEVYASSFLIVARGSNGVIGNGPDIPWRHRGDMRHFRDVTQGCALIVGRTTFDTLPKTMPGRQIVVITSRPLPADTTAIAATSLTDAIDKAISAQARVIAFAGGPRIYQEALSLPWLQTAIVTEVSTSPEGDAFMPPLGSDWHPMYTKQLVSSIDEPSARVTTYKRPFQKVFDDTHFQ